MKQNKPSIIESQLRTVDEIWPLIKNAKEPADQWLGGYFHRNRKKFGSRDRRFIAEVIYACFRHKRLFEAWSEELKLSVPVIAALYEGLVEQHALNADLENIKQGLAPGSPQGQSALEKLAFKFSFPDWLVQSWSSRFEADELDQILSSLNRRPFLTIRANALQVGREMLMTRLRAQGRRVHATKISSVGIILEDRAQVFESEEFQKGYFEVQDEGSQLICEKMEPTGEDIVWDVCAGGGGKSLALAALMNNKGRIIATDIRSKKLLDLKKRAKRAGAFNIFPAEIERLEESRYFRKKEVTKILVDAPCSGTGTLRRNPDAKWKVTAQSVLEHQAKQLEVLDFAAPHLQAGGKLYYVTCSLMKEENEDVIARFLEKHTDYELAPQSEGEYLNLYPHRQGTDGFFMAALRKK